MIKRALAIGLILASVVDADDRVERNTTFANGVTVKTESGVHVIAQPGSVWDLSQGTVIGTPISHVSWGAITGTPLNISTFPNDSGYLNSNSVPVKSFNARTGGIVLLYADVLAALGYTPADESNPHSYINAGQAPVQTVAGRTGSIVLNLSDVTGLVSVLAAKQDSITTGSTGQYLRGDLTLATFPSGLSSFTNDTNFITSAGAPVQTVAGRSGTVTLTNSDVGLGNVPNVDATNATNITSGILGGISVTDNGGWIYNVKSPPYSAIGDGSSHPLSTRYGSLGAAQAVYPFATSLSNEIDRCAIQKAIIQAMITGPSNTVSVPAGSYVFDDTLQVGYGTNFNNIVLQGAGKKASPTSGPTSGGTSFDCRSFSDRPCMNVQGARGTVIRGLSCAGSLSAYIIAHNLGRAAAPFSDLDDTDPANWNDPSLNANADSRYAPYAAITIDAYGGTAPSPAYPSVSYPPVLGAVGQYSKLNSSKVAIEDVEIDGFNAAIVVSPANVDANSDFTTINRLRIQRCKYGISIGNSQSRNVDIANVNATQCYMALTNNVHGKQQGKLGSTIRSFAIEHTLNFVGLTTFQSTTTFQNCYGEGMYKIGTINPASQGEVGITFQECEFNFTGQFDQRGVPPAVLDGPGAGANLSTTIPLRFIGCWFRNFPSVVSFFVSSARFDDCTFFTSNSRAQNYEKFAHNATGGGLIRLFLANPRWGRIKTQPYNLTTGVLNTLSQYFGPVQANASRDNGASIYSDYAAASSDPDVPPYRLPNLVNFIGKNSGSISSITVSGKTLTIVFTSRSDATFGRFGPLPGDVIWDDGNAGASGGSTWFVNSRSGNTVVATLQNNYKSTDGGATYTNPATISTSAGTLYWANSRAYVPAQFLKGDATIGSNVITNVSRDDGSLTGITEPQVGDFVFTNPTSDNWLATASCVISAIDTGVGTITVSGNALRTEPHRRLGVFLRQPPANYP